MSRQVWPDIVNRNVAQPSRVQLTRAEGVTDANVYDVVPIPGTIQAEGTKINETLFDQMEQYIKEYDIPIHTTTGTGAAYVVSVPVWVNLTQTELDGHILCIIPNVVSTSTTPTLNMNGLGAKSIRTLSGSSTGGHSALPIANYITANVPLYLIYNKTGDCWITMNAVSTPVATNTSVGTVKPDRNTTKVLSDGTIVSNAKDEIAIQHAADQLEFANAIDTNASIQALKDASANVPTNYIKKRLINVDDAWGGKALTCGIYGKSVQDGRPTPDVPVPIINVASPVRIRTHDGIFRIKHSGGLFDWSITNADNLTWYFPDGTTSNVARPSRTIDAGTVKVVCDDWAKGSVKIADNETNSAFIGDLSDLPPVTYLLDIGYCRNLTGNISDLPRVTYYLSMYNCSKLTGVLNVAGTVKTIYLHGTGMSASDTDQTLINLAATTTVTSGGILNIKKNRTSASDASFAYLSSRFTITEV